MFGQIRPQGKCFATLGTAEGLVRAVGLHVGPQVALVRKRFGADVTAERLLAGVGAQVALQQPGPRKAFATKVAITPRTTSSAMAAQMNGQRSSVVAVPEAKVASGVSFLLFLLPICTPVNRLVPLQIAAVSVGFATVWAHKLLSSRLLL